MTRSFPYLALGAFFLLGTASARAQDALAQRVKIPFTFQAGMAILPAGEYDIRFDDAEMPGVLRVRNEDGHESAFVLAQNVDVPKGSNEPRLIFTKDGDTYVLTEVVSLGAERALQVAGTHPRPGSERTETAAE